MNELRAFGSENIALALRYDIPEGPVVTCASDLFPVLNVAFGALDPDLYALAGYLRGGRSHARGAGGDLMYTGIGLRNPARSTTIAVLEHAWFVLPAAGRILMIDRTEDVVDDFTPGRVFDARQTRNAVLGSCSRWTPDLPDFGTALLELGSTTTEWHHPIVLSPGTTFWYVPSAPNVAAHAVFVWRERRMLDGETSV